MLKIIIKFYEKTLLLSSSLPFIMSFSLFLYLFYSFFFLFLYVCSIPTSSYLLSGSKSFSITSLALYCAIIQLIYILLLYMVFFYFYHLYLLKLLSVFEMLLKEKITIFFLWVLSFSFFFVCFIFFFRLPDNCQVVLTLFVHFAFFLCYFQTSSLGRKLFFSQDIDKYFSHATVGFKSFYKALVKLEKNLNWN